MRQFQNRGVLYSAGNFNRNPLCAFRLRTDIPQSPPLATLLAVKMRTPAATNTAVISHNCNDNRSNQPPVTSATRPSKLNRSLTFKKPKSKLRWTRLFQQVSSIAGVKFFSSARGRFLELVEVCMIAGACFQAGVGAHRIVELDVFAKSNSHLTGRGLVCGCTSSYLIGPRTCRTYTLSRKRIAVHADRHGQSRDAAAS